MPSMEFISTEKANNAVFTCLHFPSLVATENDGTSLGRAGTSIFRGVQYATGIRIVVTGPNPN